MSRTRVSWVRNGPTRMPLTRNSSQSHPPGTRLGQSFPSRCCDHDADINSWSDCKINALLDIIAQNPEWTQLCLGERVAKSEGKKLHAALLAISVELFDSSDPLWFDDMQARGLIRLDKLSKVWKATTLLSDTNVFQVYRKVRR